MNFPKFLLCTILLAIISTSCNPTKVDQVDQKPTIPTIDYTQKLKLMNISLPTMKPPAANYVHTVRTGNLVYTAGKGSVYPDGKLYVGKLGQDLTVAQGKEAARLSGIRLLGALQAELGDLNRVKRVVKVLGMVNATPDFEDQSSVINGFSDLIVEVFGDRGKHARSAVGVGSLPKNLAVEIEMIVEVY